MCELSVVVVENPSAELVELMEFAEQFYRGEYIDGDAS